jgi:hypothetical protein
MLALEGHDQLDAFPWEADEVSIKVGAKLDEGLTARQFYSRDAWHE